MLLIRMIETAIILAGGLGTRLKPLTDTIPKPLLPLKGKPIVQHTIEQLRKHGVKNIILSIGYRADQIKEYFGDGSNFGLNISYIIEDSPLGTGGAVKMAAQELTQPFILTWGDELKDIDYTALHKSFLRNAPQVAMVLTEREDVENFGVAKLEEEKIISFVEKPKREDAPSNLINAGAFIIEPDCLKMLPEGKSSLEKDCFENLAPLGEISAYHHIGQWYPTDTLEKYNNANDNFKPLS
jgi:mannose-1-phosphate guanylyltransferase